MASRVVLHIGAMKSGTSFIQAVLIANRAALQEQGYLFPGRFWRRQVGAVQDIIEHGGPNQPPMSPTGPWRTLAAEVNSWPGPAIISMEFLGPRPPRKIQDIVDSFDGASVEAVLTARDFARSVPAMWQESVQNGGRFTWEEYLHAVRSENRKERPGNAFWRQQSTAAIAKNWSSVVGPDHFTLVTVPPKGAPPSLLWERFTEAVGIDPAPFELEVRSNPSIGAASALVMRALNERLEKDPMSAPMYSKYVKHGLAKGILARRATPDPSFGIDESWVRKLGRREVKRVRQLGLRVVGSLDDLDPRPVPGLPVGGVTVEQQLEAALDGLEAVLRLWARDAEALAAARRGRRAAKHVEVSSREEGDEA